MTNHLETPPRSFSWATSEIPDLTGRTIIVTGASSGLGLILTQQLALRGATVLMAVRNLAKGKHVRQELLSAHPDGRLEVWPLDLLDLASVQSFAAAIRKDGRAIDVLINNGGIYNQPRRLSPQGYESQFATNHLGHFALTGLLLESLGQGHAPRVVTVSSDFYRRVGQRINVSDMNGEKRYSPVRRYGHSKLANILFGLELERRLRAAGSPIRSLLAHPGMATTPLQQNVNSVAERLFNKVMTRLVARPAEQGALPLLFAATAPEAKPGVFIGPTGPKQHVKIALEAFVGGAADSQQGKQLWHVSEDLTGVRYLD